MEPTINDICIAPNHDVWTLDQVSMMFWCSANSAYAIGLVWDWWGGGGGGGGGGVLRYMLKKL